jgi:DNA mismatch endonuclease (patch repair protein)
MTDIVDPTTRSRWMSGIRGKDTRPEIAVRSFLHRAGLRFRKEVRGLPGRPDIVLPKWRSVVLVHGCFWHRHHGCQYSYNPKSRKAFWQRKFRDNVDRDNRNASALHELGWRVHVIWECEINDDRLIDLFNDIIDSC